MNNQPTAYLSVTRDELSEEHYLLSLLNKAAEKGLLAEEEMSGIQMAAVTRLAALVRSYTHGESTSVRTEVAESVMASLLYTVGLYLKSLPSPEAALRALKTENFDDMWQKGLKRIKAKAAVIAKIGGYLKTGHPDTHAIYYRYTAEKLAPLFFKKYDARFAAHDAAILPDYPLLTPLTRNTVGIEFVQKYFEGLYIETQFWRCLESAVCEDVLHAANPFYADTPENTLRPLFFSALGAHLVGKAPREPLTERDVSRLKELLNGKSRREAETIFAEALLPMLNALGLSNASLVSYFSAFLPQAATEAVAACRAGTLNTVFLVPRRRDTQNRELFRFGKRMDDDKYSSVLYQVEHAESEEERKRLIVEKIRSLYDLEDLFVDYPFTDAEMYDILSSLHPNELAFLLKKHPAADAVEEIGLSDGEKHLRRVLGAYLLKRDDLPGIERLSLLIGDDVYEK